jgi:hypothetical protein
MAMFRVRAGTVLLFLTLATPGVTATSTPALRETPIWANDFVDTIGMNTHCSFAKIGWVDCKVPHVTAAAIKTLGVRHIRDGVSDYWKGYKGSGSPHVPTFEDSGVTKPVSAFYNELAADAGVQFDFVIGLKYGDHAPYVRDVKALVPSTESFELGGNEPDNPYNPDPCPAPNPDGLSCWPKDARAQILFYSKYVRAAGLQRIGPSIEYGPEYTCSNTPGAQRVILAPTECPSNGMLNTSVFGDESANLDALNLHYYAANSQPGGGTVTKYKAAVVRADLAAIPARTSAWMTEAGYGTGKNGNTDETIAKYEPRIYAAHLYEGIARTYRFELFDQTKAASGPYFDTFGLLSADSASAKFVPKPQYEALRSLIQIMNDPGPRPTSSSVAYSIVGGDAKLRHILAERRDDTYQLLLWVEGPDPTPSETVRLSFCSPRFTIGALSQFTPANGQYVNSVLESRVEGDCNTFGPLRVTDAMQIYRFGTKRFWPATPLPAATPFANSENTH